ncbi:MAG TPA: RNA ligase family protein [Candidatus Limnocylindria bacterium]|nr:RNA ligase family protein [Candidatus Limnocylindria bacterium]
MEYPKINSLFKRNQDNSFIFGDYSCPEFTLIKQWRIQEKIDGTNVRIIFDPAADEKVVILGRSKDSGMPTFLVEYLKNHFTTERLSTVLDTTHKSILYGEGYGNRIQSAGPFYRKDVGFMLFDIHIGSFWLTREAVQEKAQQLAVAYPPDLGIKTETEIIEFVQSKPHSLCSYRAQVMEGIIARPEPLLLFRNNKPLVWKLKVRDFE